MDWSDYDGAEMVPGKVPGVALLKGTRVPVDQIAECLDAGETIDEVAYNYDLNPADIRRLKLFKDSHQNALQS